MVIVREARIEDIPYVTAIYNQGIEERTATLESRLRNVKEMEKWLITRSDKHKVLVAEEFETIVGWASINEFSPRECFNANAGMSIYIEKESRGKGVGKTLLIELIETAKSFGFRKLILNTFKKNNASNALYKSMGFKEVGIYEKHGFLDGEYIDIRIMEKLL
ncbi:arsinothricin resistance N-acetyltransferase ArsN1 family A [Clostridium cellulovorans]|uniref:GCN5-related N-acetyltransferase n=1 Tax=Clostridium cellulovorans (strain ATCC 35296 / DSM 3052 / OCM 3 / 743B) TaxID=573061 RepID=D9SQ98_CLOC7|nr:arsinothricin resistance N-acetyltransferase ArsN1 family A [Clostridium cellulovorans]ADL50165.1 GCN5-related N-acetyltransferase [Clostridium cellulovorans 743B]